MHVGDRVIAIAGHPARDFSLADVHTFSPKDLPALAVIIALSIGGSLAGVIGALVLLGVFPLVAGRLVETARARRLTARWPRPSRRGPPPGWP